MATHNFIFGEWNNIYISENDEQDIIKYISDYLSFNVIIETKILIKKNGIFDRCRIDCRIKENNDNDIILIVYPEENKFIYILDKKKEVYICDKKIKSILDKMTIDFKEVVKQFKKQQQNN